jgi:hypothetical protein
MIFPPIIELSVVGVLDAGVPNQERIVIRPTQVVNLAQFGVLLAQRTSASVMPLRDHLFWFSEIMIAPPSWVFVYTGGGQYQETVVPETNEKAYVLHWGKPHTLFNVPNLDIVPIVFRINAVSFAEPIRSGQPRAALPPAVRRQH